MTYASVETSTETGSPAELYDFVYGPNHWRYTSGAEPVSYLSNVFTPAAITRGPISNTSTATDRRLEVRAYGTIPVAELFRIQPPSGVVTLILYRRHLLDTANEFIVAWMGRVLGCGWEENEAVFRCEPDYSSVKRTGLRRIYSKSCPWDLYGVGCNLTAAAFALPSTSYSVSGRTVTVSALSAYADNYFAGGYIEYTNPALNTQEYVSIRSSSLGALTLSLLPLNLIPPTPIKVYPGCDHTIATCQTKFGNAANYGGQPYIPSMNPFGGSTVF